MNYHLHHGDCRDILRWLVNDDSIDSIVCDPPYHLTSIVKRFGKPGSAPVKLSLTDSQTGSPFARGAKGFMGKEWDGGDIAFQPETWKLMLDALKPGGYLVAFGGSRTYHRMACAIEDAGFEIRDCIMWLYGQGFPKSHNQTDEWDGWGSALKPAHEPIIMARKPLEGSIRQNLDKWGVGAINIKDSRIATDSAIDDPRLGGKGSWKTDKAAKNVYEGGYAGDEIASSPLGRWPANVIHDGSDEVLEQFPDAKGQQGDLKNHDKIRNSPNGIFGTMAAAADHPKRNDDSTSAARFFYCAKASKSDREDGCENLSLKQGGQRSETSGQHITRRDGGDPKLVNNNNHPTVKPTALMRYLCRMVTPPNGLILDPFTGSGSTGKAALLEGFRFVGIEKDAEYIPIAEARLQAALKESFI